jgi:hypothetical protein
VDIILVPFPRIAFVSQITMARGSADDDDDTKSQSAGAIKIIGSELFSIGKGASEIALRQNNASGACNVIICSESFDVGIAACAGSRESIDFDSVAMPAF